MQKKVAFYIVPVNPIKMLKIPPSIKKAHWNRTSTSNQKVPGSYPAD